MSCSGPEIQTGTNKYVPEFYLTLFTMEAILRRMALKDASVFVFHNKGIQLDEDVKNMCITFNLYSEWGVGTRLKPLIKCLLKESSIVGEGKERALLENGISLDDPYYKEIKDLLPWTGGIRMLTDRVFRDTWITRYLTDCLEQNVGGNLDDIDKERLVRTAPLFMPLEYVGALVLGMNPHPTDYYLKDVVIPNERGEPVQYNMCLCSFCKEMSRYIVPPGTNIEAVIATAIYRVDNEESDEDGNNENESSKSC